MKPIRNIFKLSLVAAWGILIAIIICSGCGGTFRRPAAESDISGTERTAADIYAPLGLPSDYDNIPQQYPPNISAPDSNSRSVNQENSKVKALASDRIDSYIYRLQLFSSNIYTTAAREYKIAQEVFDKEVFLDFEVPYYKIRMGNFATHAEAETYLPAAQEAGYQNAWVVKVNINIRNLEGMYDNTDIPSLPDTIKTGDSLETEAETFENNEPNSED